MTKEFRLIGRPVRQEEWRAAFVLARDSEGRILMQLRDSHDGVAAPGKWCFFGGEVENGEDLGAAACREFHEETGVTLMRAELAPLARFASTSRPNGMVYAFVTSRILSGDQIRLGEGAGFAFLTPEQIAQFDVIENVAEMLKKLKLT